MPALHEHTPLLQTVLLELPAATLRITSGGVIVGMSREAEHLFEILATDVLGAPVTQLLNLDKHLLQPDAEQLLCLAATHWAVGSRARRASAQRSTGESIRVSINSYIIGSPEHFEIVMVLDDMTAAGDVFSDTAQSATRFKTLTRLAPVGILELDANWRCQYANDKWYELSRQGIDESLDDGWVRALHPEDVSETLVALHDAVSKLESRDHELRLHTPLGETTWVSMTATGLFDRTEGIKGILVVATDITERYRANEELRRIAMHDALTGLKNRKAFMQALREATAPSQATLELGVLFLDLDGFKAVNDTLGHHAGDRLLKDVADRLTRQVESGDTVARLGGDEFTILVPRHRVMDSCERIASNIVASLSEPFLIDGQHVRISTSIGITIGCNHQLNEESFLRQADLALYRAKRSGRAQYVFYIPELDRARRDHSALITRLSHALDKQEFEVHYQPQIDIASGRMVGLEALLRWPASGFPEANTEDYISALEDNGLIGRVGDWVLHKACADLCYWRDSGLVTEDVRLSVNVSARQLAGRTFLPRFREGLAGCGVEADRIVVEITESTAISNNESGVINRLKDLGVGISIDDFGTGFSSLAYLGRLPADEIKIDKSFIHAMPNGEQARPLVTGILALAKSLGLEAVAEGVEDASILPELAAAGCATYQGFLYSKPVSAEQINQLMLRRPRTESGLLTTTAC